MDESNDRAERELRAELYAALHDGTPGDIRFVLAACADELRVLKLGCGDGRIARALAEAGHQVVGIDVDEARIARGRAQNALLGPEALARIDLRVGDMRNASLGERFSRIVVAHSTIYCAADDDEIRSMLRVAHAHLVPGGQLIIDAYAADPFHSSLDPTDSDPWEPIGSVEAGAITWRVLERSDWDRDAQRLCAHYRYQPTHGERDVIEMTIEHRYVLAAQLLELLRAERFDPALLVGGFDGRPYDEDAEQLIVIAERD